MMDLREGVKRRVIGKGTEKDVDTKVRRRREKKREVGSRV